MITLTWYNIVAIVVGIIFLISFVRTCAENETGFLGGLSSALEGIFIIFITTTLNYI